MTEHKCPAGGECKFIDDLWHEIRYVKKKNEDDLSCVKKRQGDFVSMGILKILITVLIILFGGIMTLGWSIKSDINTVDKAIGINSQRLSSIEKHIDKSLN